MTTVTERRRGSRVSPRRRRPGHRRATRSAAVEDRRPFWIYVYDPERALMVSDGLNYIGQHVAKREAAKLSRLSGQPAEARLSPRA